MRIANYMRLALTMIIGIMLSVGAPVMTLAQGTAEASPVVDGGIRVMSYNTHHASGNDECEDPETPEGEVPEADCTLDLERLSGVISAEDPSIVGLQEVDRFWARSGGVDQPEALATMLDMNSCYGANLDHEADDHADEHHEYGVATLTSYPIIGCENHFLPTTEGWEQRGMLDTRIEVPGIGEVAVINTHLQANVSGEPEEAARQRTEQAQAISDHVESLEVPVIVMGDLNSNADSGEIDSLIGSDSSLTDVWTIGGSGVGNTIFDGAHGEPTARIDYILVTDHFGVSNVRVVDNEGSRMSSDHFPLIVDLTITGEATPQATPR